MVDIKKELINLLPNDIIHKIISYTYNIQNKELLNDIKSFYLTKYELKYKYQTNYNWFFTRYSWHENNNLYVNYINYIVDEINIYMKTKIRSKNIYNYILERSFNYRTIEEAKIFLFKLSKLNIGTQFNILLGLLRENERKYFLKKMDLFYT